MKRVCTLLAMFAVAALVCVSAPKQADARPQYLKSFTEKYESVAAKAGELKCGVCHGDGGKNKKVVSDYGKALGKALGAKNVKEPEKIAEALDKAGMEKASDGKTYAEHLAAGELPAAAE